ncbi:YaaA family protein [Bradyrhizobium sp. WD16]|uniref:YaaA family protein n=1 Tax=Bradyrhizobium sp. WD16 TaxID=1521768 RepID=UPI0020A3C618|nr:YaaA family protein [Bradyrhizobium sp. WD16]UTD26623.1 hypothetical protein DB459_06485 [Bradyrhizobium sp. WD16]
MALTSSDSIRPDAASFFALISCSKSKGGHKDIARDMYVSPLYRKSVQLAELWGVPFYILSAKYGLLRPDELIEPYEQTLKSATKKERQEWAQRVDKQLRELPRKEFIVLAGDDYFAPLVEAGSRDPLNYFAPMRSLSLGTRLAYLNEALKIERRSAAVRAAYELFEKMSASQMPPRLSDLLTSDLPTHGVYFFFDESETTRFSTIIPRLVRIGTHGISAGSTATLRNRLRTHFGTRAGQGNHRASVFRLHVGRALIERDNLQGQFPDWGKGQSAPREITDREAALEAKVSQYIGNLRVLAIPVIDTAGKSSMRATVERQFIAMFTEHLCALESGSPNWLGKFSDKPSIKETGLWNVRDVGEQYDLKFMTLLEAYLNKSSHR